MDPISNINLFSYINTIPLTLTLTSQYKPYFLQQTWTYINSTLNPTLPSPNANSNKSTLNPNPALPYPKTAYTLNSSPNVNPNPT